MADGLSLITANPATQGFNTAIETGQNRRRFEEESQGRQDALMATERQRNLDDALAGLLSGPAANIEPATGGVPAAGAPSAGIPPIQSTVGPDLARQGFGVEALNMITAGQQIQRQGAQRQEGFAREDAQRAENFAREDAQTAQTRQDEAERNAFVALARYGKTGNPADLAEFQALAGRAQIQVPPSALQDARRAGQFAEGSLIAERIYGANPQQAGAFVRAYLQSNGDMLAAAQAAGIPTDKPNWNIETVIQNGEHVLALVDTVSGQVQIPQQTTPTPGAPGEQAGGGPSQTQQPFQVPVTASRAASQPAKLQMVEWLMRNNVAASPEEAWQLVNQGVESPNKIRAQVFNGVFRAVMGGFPTPSAQEAENVANEVANEFVRNMTEIGGLGGEGVPSAPAGAQPGAPAAGGVQDIPVTAAGTIDSTRAVPNQDYRLPDGRVFRFLGNDQWQETQ